PANRAERARDMQVFRGKTPIFRLKENLYVPSWLRCVGAPRVEDFALGAHVDHTDAFMGLPLAMMWLGDCLRRSAEPALLAVKRGHTREPHVRVVQLAEMPHARHQRQPRARADVLL